MRSPLIVRNWIAGMRLAISWLTVIPVRGPDTVDRAAAGRAIASAPVVGIALGGVASALLFGSITAGISPAVGGFLTVAALALLTRGMHIDGLADTADGLGCYGPPERAREVMKSGSVGPFGVASVGLVLGIQALGLAQLAQQQMWWAIVLVVAAGRVAVVIACRIGIDSASAEGFGALVAGTQSRLSVVLWTIGALAAAVCAWPDRLWQGPIVVAVALTVSVLTAGHCVRRFGGLSGDVLGASVETTAAVVAVGLLLGS